jgi:hypothetical protein
MLTAPVEAALDGKYVSWFGRMINVEPSPYILTKFIRLHEKNDVEILRFVMSYGTLTTSWEDRTSKTFSGGRELLSDWRKLSRHAMMLLEIAHNIHDGTTHTLDHWNSLIPPRECMITEDNQTSLGSKEERRERYASFKAAWDATPNIPERFLGSCNDGPEQQRGEVATILFNELRGWSLKFGAPTFEIESDAVSSFATWRTALDFRGSLPCYIGFQLLLTITRADVFTCSACRYPYIRTKGRSAPKGFRKKPKPGERNYCQDTECIRERNRIARANFRRQHEEP